MRYTLTGAQTVKCNTQKVCKIINNFITALEHIKLGNVKMSGIKIVPISSELVRVRVPVRARVIG